MLVVCMIAHDDDDDQPFHNQDLLPARPARPADRKKLSRDYGTACEADHDSMQVNEIRLRLRAAT